MGLLHQIGPDVVWQMLKPYLNPAAFVADLERTV
jgi:hypothetical protein